MRILTISKVLETEARQDETENKTGKMESMQSEKREKKDAVKKVYREC